MAKNNPNSRNIRQGQTIWFIFNTQGKDTPYRVDKIFVTDSWLKHDKKLFLHSRKKIFFSGKKAKSRCDMLNKILLNKHSVRHSLKVHNAMQKAIDSLSAITYEELNKKISDLRKFNFNEIKINLDFRK